MNSRFVTRSEIAVERTLTDLDYEAGFAPLVDRLDSERGVFLSSGVEFPDRYSQWDIGVVEPPMEIVARGRAVRFRALNERGERLLRILRPLIVGGEGETITADTAGEIALAIAHSDRIFAEEERSLQPSVFSPLRRLIGDFAGIEDGTLGLYGAFGYDLIFQFERIDLSLDRSGGYPDDLHLFLSDSVHVLDRRMERAVRYDYEFTRDRDTTVGAARMALAPLAPPVGNLGVGAITADRDAGDYAAMVDAARARMRVGDIFEVVLSRRFRAAYGGRPSDLFRIMQGVNPSPYEFLIQLGPEQLVGASPEMFVRVEGRRVESCPISGTIRRGQNPMEDAENIRELYNSEKDEVELTMCTDVDRNDKSRICEPGTIRLLGRKLIERYAGLFHTVDHVEGILREGFAGIDAFLSHMWAVTLTGAPKKNAMRIVEEMETTARGWYGGAVGALLMNGDVNTGITIRTVHLKDGEAGYRAGATLVFDSDGLAEAEETVTKATAFFRILEGPDGAAHPTPPVSAAPHAGASVVMIDNEDSFVHTLADYFRQTGARVRTYRFGAPLDLIREASPDLVVHSPGPGQPSQFGVAALVRALAEAGIPQFGVCLGLQGIVEAFGGTLAVLDVPRHGKRWSVRHGGNGLFADVPDPCDVGAYHSLIAVRDDIPPELEVTAWTEAGLVMAVRHKKLPIQAVQFHPESILSMRGDIGHVIVGNVMHTLATRK